MNICELEASLGYIMSFRSAKAIYQDLVTKQKRDHLRENVLCTNESLHVCAQCCYLVLASSSLHLERVLGLSIHSEGQTLLGSLSVLYLLVFLGAPGFHLLPLPSGSGLDNPGPLLLLSLKLDPFEVPAGLF